MELGSQHGQSSYSLFPPYDMSMMTKDFTGTQSKPVHRLVHTFEYKSKHCLYCQICKIKTKSGWRPTTRHRCEACEVPLCKGERGCFYLYHKMLQDSTGHMLNVDLSGMDNSFAIF